MISPVSVRKQLLEWYDANKRDLPWRETSDPYRVWLSEIMLQQTTVETVIPYYHKFLSRFPTLKSVAEASIDDLLLLWQGLGYYNRIRQFHRAAQRVANEWGGIIPTTKEELIRLPGLGPYTAGAVASIAFGQPVSAVDGNIIRVLSRLFHFTEDAFTTQAKKYFGEKASSLVDPVRPGDFNQALMDLGSSVCTPTRPACLLCPLNNFCQACRKGKPETLPIRLKKTVYRKEELICLLYLRGGKFWLRRRRPDEIMAGLWEFPLRRQGRRPYGLQLAPVSHTIMNRRITVHPYKVEVSKFAEKDDEGRWIRPDNLHELPLTTITRKVLHQYDTGWLQDTKYAKEGKK
ncbi:MAG: A/G-specific adenine glycosylase [Deltaproteobacteria bacterium]|nr:A/G-specific adenine glycosylase [Deltaproteobacteria bacterium]